MGRITSKGFIRLHALFQFALAIYLTNSPETITSTELVYNIRDGPRIDNFKPFTLLRSPFAYCGILLVSFALFDLTLAIKLPTLNHVLAIAQYVRRHRRHHHPGRQQRQQRQQHRRQHGPTTAQPSRRTRPRTQNPALAPAASASELNDAADKITAEFSTLYRQLCVLLVTLRVWIFMVVALRICMSPESEWDTGSGPGRTPTRRTVEGGKLIIWFGNEAFLPDSGPTGAGSRSGAGMGVDELKSKVVLAYGVMEILFSCWFIVALQYEKKRAQSQMRWMGGLNPPAAS
ncbi:hypothetical protein FQN57_000921 [Myotisia sp. PD_48]|nr:hypothetical protein FQN57_000921 [Myotisia sp. PD_48]